MLRVDGPIPAGAGSGPGLGASRTVTRAHPRRRGEGNILHHQNTLYEATVPAALFVAAILPDPRTTRAIDKDRHSFPGCLRAELLA